MIRLSERSLSLPPSAAMEIDARARELKALGGDVISFCVGEPDLPMPEEASAAAVEAVRRGDMKYTYAAGMPEMRQAVCAALLRDTGVSYAPENVAVTDGAKFAGYAAVLAVCDPGDEVILPSPYWTSYLHFTRLAGAVPVVVPCSPENGFRLTAEQLEKAVTPRTKALILNNPGNPTGAMYSEGELRSLCGKALELGVTVIADEIYSAYTYGAPFVSAASLGEEFRDNTVLVNGLSKNYAMTGWRLGYLAAPAPVIRAVTAMLSHTTGCPGTVAQRAAIAALLGDQKAAKEMAEEFRTRKELICRLASEAGLRFREPEGAFYLFADVREYGPDAVRFASGLLEKKQVAVLPCDDFGAPGYVRLSYTLPRSRIREGMERIAAYLKELKNG